MKKEDYVSLEVAMLLKEKGFNYKVLGYYDLILEELNFDLYPKDYNFIGRDKTKISAPTLYQAEKWLREKLLMHIIITPKYNSNYEIIEYEYKFTNFFSLLNKIVKWNKSKERYEKYEECLNSAILEALKWLDNENNK